MSSKGKGKDKGKAIAGKGSSAKRKRDDDKTGGRKRINRAVLQFFEDAADEASDYDTSDFEDDFPDDDDHEVPKEQVEPGRLRQLPVFPKEEELSGDELERVLEERYKSGSAYVTYAEDDYETKGVDKNFVVPSAQDPVIWKVKCKIGRERQSIFCLMQKYVDLKSLGTKLQIVSAFSVEHVRGFIFVEANKQFEVMEACKQLPDVYYSMIIHVPSSEFSQLLAVRRKQTEVSKGMWVRLKHGNYKDDLAQVVGVSDSRKKATVKLIPRVDFQALAAKFGAGSSIKRSVIPKPRLITSSDLEEFRPLIQYRRDRDTGMQFEVLDSLMLKDGFLYKKVSIDSLRFCDVNPSTEELQKFRTSNNEDSGNLEFLSQLYGDKKEKSTLKPVQGGGKGEGTSGSKEKEGIQVHDLVLFGKREFGMVLGMEKDESYKILKYGSEGSAVVSLAKKDLKNLNLEKKFNALDHRMKTIFFNDVVKILDGPLKDKEGVVKQIYRGIIFLYDQNDLEDNAYFCAKSQLCEKVKHNDISCLGKNGEAGPSGCEDLPSSPKTPLSPEKPWQTEEQDRNFNRREQEGGFSVGQSLRIRVGPLKGYLCRVLAVRRSDVTVKLDSRSKVLTVKSEHLSEVRGKSFATSTCDDTGLDSSKPFDFLGNNDGGNDWMASSVNADKNEDGQSNEGSAWPAFTSSASAQPWGASSVDISGSTAAEDDAWQKKPSTTLEGDSSWGQDVVKADSSSAPPNDATSSWDKDTNITGSTSSWGNVSAKKSCENTTQASQNAWDQSKSSQDKGTSSPVKGSWGKAVDTWGNKCSSSGIDDWKAPSTDLQNGGTGGASWSQPEEQKEAGGWKKTNEDAPGANSEVGGDNWGKPKSSSGGASWTKSDLKLDDGLTQHGGWTGGRGSGERSSGTAAWDSGNSGSSGWVKPSESDKDSEGKWGSVKAGDASDVQPDSWKKPNSSGAEGASWGKPAGNPSGEDAPSWVSAGNGGWGQSSRSDNDQESNGGRGFGGRRGRGNYGGRFDQSGGGRGRSGGRGQWNKEGQDWQSSAKGEGSSWGQEKGGSSWGDAASAGKDDQSGAGGWGKDKGGNGWGNSSGGGTQGEGNSWGKKGGDTGGGGWGKSSGGGTDGGGWGSSSGGNGWGNSSGGGTQGEGSSWGQEKGGNSWGDAASAGKDDQNGAGGWGKDKGGNGWGNSSGGGTQGEGNSWGKKGGDTGGGGWGKSSGGGTDGGGWGSSSGGNGWGNSSGGGTQGEGNSWGKKGGDTGGGGWGKSSGGSTDGGGWGSSSGGGTGGGGWGTGSYGGSKGDEGGGGRGRGDFGGRRGRGGYRGGGRDQGGGRGRGRSFGGGRQSWNSDGQDKPSWGSSGGNGNQGGGWGSNKDGNEGGGGGRGSWGGTSGGGWGSKKDANEGGGGGRGSWSGSSGGGWGSDKDGNEGGGGGGGRGSWGGSSGGGGSWGSSPGGSTGGAKGNESGGGGGGWGGSTGGSTVAGGWGAGSSGGSKDKECGGSGWGKSEGGDAGSGGWANSAGGKIEAGGSSGGWGNSSGGSKDKEGGGSGWGKSEGGDAGSGGWANSAGGKSEAGGSSGGWGNSAGGKSEAGGSSGWGKDAAGGGGGNSSGGGNNDKGGGWGKGGW